MFHWNAFPMNLVIYLNIFIWKITPYCTIYFYTKRKQPQSLLGVCECWNIPAHQRLTCAENRQSRWKLYWQSYNMAKVTVKKFTDGECKPTDRPFFSRSASRLWSASLTPRCILYAFFSVRFAAPVSPNSRNIWQTKRCAQNTNPDGKLGTRFLPICQNQMFKDFQGPYEGYIRRTKLTQTGTFISIYKKVQLYIGQFNTSKH